MFYWIIGVSVLGIVLYFIDREIYFYEATHLGSRIQSWLYDRWAKKYDTGKKESQLHDAEMLARPVLDFLKDVPSPLILDLATGTGRLPLALLREPEFSGHVIAVDVSAGMLAQASQKLKQYQGAFTLVQKIDYPLPFPDATFDVVSCMEALEVMPEMQTPLAELFRVLKPGGMLISSRGTDASGRAAKVLNVEDFKKVLQNIGFEQVDVIPWWRWFDRVIAHKAGVLSTAVRCSVWDVFICESCQTANFEPTADVGLKCRKCGNMVSKNADEVLIM